MLRGFTLGLGLTIATTSVAAQDIPMVDAVGAYSHSQVCDTVTEKDQKRIETPDPTELGHRRSSALSPEARRVKRDGGSSLSMVRGKDS